MRRSRLLFAGLVRHRRLTPRVMTTVASNSSSLSHTLGADGVLRLAVWTSNQHGRWDRIPFLLL